jgi:hypothetical protein
LKKQKSMPVRDQKDNVELVISNQSFDINPVDIGILVDGKKILSENFFVEGDQPAQHNWQRHHIFLDDGPHHLKVSSQKGDAQIETTLHIKNTLTVTIAYWYNSQPGKKKSKGFFTVDSGENRVATM